MKIQSPFGEIPIYFYRNNHCRLAVNGADVITINGVQLKFSKELAIFNHQWAPVASDSRGEFYQSSCLELRFAEIRRNGSPSSSAHGKLLTWIKTVFIEDLRRGVYATQLHEAERQHFSNEIAHLKRKIAECLVSIRDFEKLVATHQATLATLP